MMMMAVAVAVAVAGCGDDSGDSVATSTGAGASPTPATPAPDPVRDLLLPAATVGSMTNATLPDVAESAQLQDNGATIDRPECAPALDVAARAAYGNTGFTAVQRATLRTAPDASYFYVVDQAVVSMLTPERAAQLLVDAEQRWQTCVGTPITATDGSSTTTVLNVENRSGSVVSDRMVDGSGPRHGCQHTLAAKATIVADVVVCSDVEVGDRSQAIAEAILAQVE